MRRGSRASGGLPAVVVGGVLWGGEGGGGRGGGGLWVLCGGGVCYGMVRVWGRGVVVVQTIQGPDTVFRWAEICQAS